MEEKLYSFEEVKEIIQFTIRCTVKETLGSLTFKIVLPEEEQK